MDTKKIKNFVKDNWGKIAFGVVSGGLIGYGLTQTYKHVTGDWTSVSTEGLSNVNWARKWTGKDEWNGCIHACIDNVTMDELCETGKQLLANGDLPEDTKVKAVQFITEGIK